MFSTLHPFGEENIASSKGEHPIFKEKQTFHKKCTVLIRLPLLFLEGEDAQVFREKLPHPKVDGALVFR